MKEATLHDILVTIAAPLALFAAAILIPLLDADGVPPRTLASLMLGAGAIFGAGAGYSMPRVWKRIRPPADGDEADRTAATR